MTLRAGPEDPKPHLRIMTGLVLPRNIPLPADKGGLPSSTQDGKGRVSSLSLCQQVNWLWLKTLDRIKRGWCLGLWFSRPLSWNLWMRSVMQSPASFAIAWLKRWLLVVTHLDRVSFQIRGHCWNMTLPWAIQHLHYRDVTQRPGNWNTTTIHIFNSNRLSTSCSH